MDPSHFQVQVCQRPEGSQLLPEPADRPKGCRCRRRLCLLKGCERLFCPKCPQARYCSSTCQQTAKRWWNQQSSRRYRASEGGRKKRREQSQRQRQRQREQRLATPVEPIAEPVRPAPTEPPLLTAAEPAAASVVAEPAAAGEATAVAAVPTPVAAPVASADVLAWRVGQPPALGCEDCWQRRCARPGCYEWFVVRHEPSSKRFCSVACRLALRRVVDREERYQARRRRMRCERVTKRARLPDTS